VDATCKRVKASQMRARALSAAGAAVFLAGEKNHGEIIGVRGYVTGPCFVVANPSEAASAAADLLRENPAARAALLGQTTISPQEYAGIAREIRRFFPGLEVIGSICGATRDRQEALRELSGQADAFVIAGGRESANTRRLLAIAEGCGKRAWLAETAADIPPEVRAYAVIGLSAGASTPDEALDGIEQALLASSNSSDFS
jgi:4-hydroxy-3-methylbut-2-enyl diphosphate reductase